MKNPSLIIAAAGAAAAFAAWKGWIPGLSGADPDTLRKIVESRTPAAGATNEQLQEAQRAVRLHVESAQRGAIGAGLVGAGLGWAMSRQMKRK